MSLADMIHRAVEEYENRRPTMSERTDEETQELLRVTKTAFEALTENTGMGHRSKELEICRRVKRVKPKVSREFVEKWATEMDITRRRPNGIRKDLVAMFREAGVEVEDGAPR